MNFDDKTGKNFEKDLITALLMAGFDDALKSSKKGENVVPFPGTTVPEESTVEKAFRTENEMLKARIEELEFELKRTRLDMVEVVQDGLTMRMPYETLIRMQKDLG